MRYHGREEPPMPWEKQFNVEEILDKAMQAFWTRGYEATSMQDLVDCTGVNRASLYATYGDKRELFLAALRRYDEHMRKVVVAELEAKFDPRDAIRRLFEIFVEQAATKKEKRGCFLTNTALELAAHDAAIGRIVANAQAEIEAFFTRMIVKAKALGEVPASLKPVPTARGLLASLLGLVVLSRSRPDPELLRAVVDDAMRRLG
jgi:TetR/AcrR family transcriptional repressor of nem operon